VKLQETSKIDSQFSIAAVIVGATSDINALCKEIIGVTGLVFTAVI